MVQTVQSSNDSKIPIDKTGFFSICHSSYIIDVEAYNWQLIVFLRLLPAYSDFYASRTIRQHNSHHFSVSVADHYGGNHDL